MEQYISKSVLMTEIKRRINEYNTPIDRLGSNNIRLHECKDILSFLDTLEVKEVDINKEISQFIDANFEKATIGHKLSLKRVAKHFFELGLKAHNNNKVD